MSLRDSAGRYVAICLTVVLILGLMLVGTAYAQTPATDQYGTRVAGVAVSAEESGAQAAPAAQALPNTGLSLLGVVVVGGLLVITGLAIRRRDT